jgi:alginate O-acetyltransferase complex protein AlgJ
VIKGKDGFFFYADDGAMDDYAWADPLTPEAIMNWRESLERAHRWLDARRIGYLFVIAPDKHVVYGDSMPDAIVRTGTTSRTDQLYGDLVNTGFVVDVRPALFAAKGRERIYFKTDTHWNDRGAEAAYETIIAAVRAQVPAIPAAWTRADFEPAVEDVEAGDLAAMMGLKRILREENLALRVNRPRLARVVEPSGATELAEVGRLVTAIPASTLPRAVIFRDSFTSRLVPFLSEHFSRAVYLWQNDFDSQVVEQEKPDIVIQQIVGRHLYNFIPSPELVPTDR